MRHLTATASAAVLILLTACQAAGPDGPGTDLGVDGPGTGGPAAETEHASFLADGKADAFGVREGTPEALGVLSLVNATGYAELTQQAGLDSWAASYIVATRAGADRTWSTSDDVTYRTLAQLDDVPYVGAWNFARLLAYARAIGFIDSTGTCSSNPAVPSTCRGTCDANKVCQASYRWQIFPIGKVATRYHRPQPSYPDRGRRCTMSTCSGPWNCVEGQIDNPMGGFDLTGLNPGPLTVSIVDSRSGVNSSTPLSYARTAQLSFASVYDAATVWTLSAREITPTSAKVTWKRERKSYSIPLGGDYVTEGVYCGEEPYTASPIP